MPPPPPPADPRDIVDIPGIPSPHADATPRAEQGGVRPWLGILFTCCSVYARVYKHPSGRKYAGNCPRCAKPFEVTVGAGGTNHRFFEAG